MKIQNVNSEDNNGCYEILVICNNFSEFDECEDLLLDAQFSIESFCEYEISVYSYIEDYTTKKDFEMDIKRTLKRRLTV